MKIRRAEQSELTEILRVYRAAKAYMDATGNETQWEVGYPSEAMVRKDISEGKLFVVTEGGKVHAAFYFSVGEDETYRVIEQGEWKNDMPYGVIHRVGSDGVLHGVVRECVGFCKQTIPNLRIDTHENNKTMQNALERIGFERCGVIRLQNGDPRIAYQLY